MNETKKYTPGPWFACAGDDCDDLKRDGERIYFPHVHIGPRDHERTYVSGDGNRYPARSENLTVNCVSGGGATMDTHDANARLIAAAPTMLEAHRTNLVGLENAAEWVERQGKSTPVVKVILPQLREMIDATRAALAKAEEVP